MLLTVLERSCSLLLLRELDAIIFDQCECAWCCLCHEIPIARGIQSVAEFIAHSIIEHFQNIVILKPMVRALPSVFLVTFPSIIERFVGLLLEIRDLMP